MYLKCGKQFFKHIFKITDILFAIYYQLAYYPGGHRNVMYRHQHLNSAQTSFHGASYVSI